MILVVTIYRVLMIFIDYLIEVFANVAKHKALHIFSLEEDLHLVNLLKF